MISTSTKYADKDLKKNLRLEFHRLRSEADWEFYNQCLSVLPQTPFIKKEILPDTPDQELVFFILLDENNTLLVLLPVILRKIILDRKFTGYLDVTSPYGYGGPVFKNGVDETLMHVFWNEVDKWYKENNIVSEFIRFSLNENWKGYNGILVPTLKNVCGRILPEEEQWKNFRPKVRNNIRKALQFGLNGEVYHGKVPREAIEEFYEIYSKTMHRHQAEKQYLHSLEYFTSFIEKNPESCAIATIYHNQTPISTELVVISEDAIYSFLGGTDSDYFHMRPNDLLKLKVLEWARQKGFSFYHLGGGREENDSLYSYKKRFFPKDEDCIFYTGRKIVNSKLYETLVNQNKFCSGCQATFFPLYRCRMDC